MKQRRENSPLEMAVRKIPEIQPSPEQEYKTHPEEVWALWLEYLDERRKVKQGDGDAAFVETLQQELAVLHRSLTPDEQKMLRDRVIDVGDEDAKLHWNAGEKNILLFKEKTEKRNFLRQKIADIDAKRFAQNGAMDQSEYRAIQEAKLRAELARVSSDLFDMEHPDDLTKKSSALSIFIAAERVKNYAKSLHETGFALTPSREKLMDKITQMLLTSRRPVFLSGVSGGGKTAMIRAIARQLTGREPFEANEAAKEDIRLLYGVRLMDENNQAYIEYGPLGRALTGKTTSKEKSNGHGGVFYLDEANGLRASDLRELIKLLSGKKPGDTVQFSALGGHDVIMAPGFRFVMAGNLKSAKHSDRTELPPEVVRDMETIDITAMPQHETYQLLLAELMDQNNRIRVSAKDVAPCRTSTANADGTFRLKIDETESHGGALWRFSKLVTKIQDAFANENPASPRLFGAVLDIGKALSWVQSYRRLGQRAGVSLGVFLEASFAEWKASAHSEEDRATLHRLFSDIDGAFLQRFNGPTEPSSLPMSTKDIGSAATFSDILVTPDVKKSPEPKGKVARNKDLEDIRYTPESFENLVVGKKYTLHSSPRNVYIFEGLDDTPRKNLVFLLEKQQFSEKFTPDSSSRFTLIPEPTPPPKAERPLGVAEKEMKDLLGKYYFGSEAAETTCSIDGGKKKLFTLSPAEKQQASELLRAKLAEPDVKQFIGRLNADPTEKEKWMLVYVPQKLIPKRMEDDKTLTPQQIPLSLSSLAQILDKDLKPAVNLVYEAETRSQSTGFFGKNTFATEQIPPGWHFVSKTVLAGTTSKLAADQKTALFTEADRLGFARGKWQQTHPALRFFALISNYKNNNGERLMQNVYDRSDVQTASGHLARVGFFDTDGLSVCVRDGAAGSHIGASLSR